MCANRTESPSASRTADIADRVFEVVRSTRVLEVRGPLDCLRLERELPSLSGQDSSGLAPGVDRLVVTRETCEAPDVLSSMVMERCTAITWQSAQQVWVGIWRLGADHHAVSIALAPDTATLSRLGVLCAAVAGLFQPVNHREQPQGPVASADSLLSTAQGPVLAPALTTDRTVDQDPDQDQDQAEQATEALELGDPVSGRRVSGRNRLGRRTAVAVGQGLARKVTRQARERGVTPEAFLLAALDVTLRRWTGKSHFTVGLLSESPAQHAGGGGQGGGPLPTVLRRRMEANADLRAIVNQADEDLRRAADAHEGTGGDPVARGDSTAASFEVAFASDHLLVPSMRSLAEYVPGAALGEPSGPWTVRGLSLSVLPMPHVALVCDMQLVCRTSGGSLQASVWWDPRALSASAIEAFASDYLQVLRQLCSTSPRRVRDIRLTSRWDMPHVTLHPSMVVPQAGAEFPAEALQHPIHDRFLFIAETYPEHVALDTAQGTVTYTQLARLARNTAAGLVRACGSGPGNVVLLLSDPVETVAAILGTMMAGKTYVPLDPAYPQVRLELVLADAEPEAVVVGSDAKKVIGKLTGAAARYRVVDLATMFARDASAPNIAVPPEAYVSLLYTSGSTSRPKGVLQSHRNVLFHIRNLTNLFQISPSDRHSVTASFSFDASTSDMFSALLNGAALVPINILRDGLNTLGRVLQDKQVTLYHSTPTVFRHIPESADPARYFAGVRLVILGGEPVTQQDVRVFHRWFGTGSLLVNGYGSTETSGFSAMHIITQGEADSSPVLPIGRPMPGLEFELRDADGLEARVEGELFVKSAHLGVGYWNNSEASRGAFTVEKSGGREYRVYRTGDIVRRTRGEGLRLLGRRDRQVKIHGQRLEISEIESALAALPGVAQAAVSIVRDPRSDTDELAAYVRPDSTDVSLAPVELRRMLSEQLPTYMVPTYLTVMDSLPMTPTGKIDVRALPKVPRETPHSVIRPGDLTPTERTVHRVWCDVLALDTAGLDQNFFDVGGHSLLMARVHSRLEELFARHVPLHRLFENSTIRKVAHFLDQGHAETVADEDLRDQVMQRVSRRQLRQSARSAGRKR